MFYFKSEDKVFLYSVVQVILYAFTALFVLATGRDSVIFLRLEELLKLPFLSGISFLSLNLWCCFFILFCGGIARVFYSAGDRSVLGYLVVTGLIFVLQVVMSVFLAVCLMGKWNVLAMIVFSAAGACMVLQAVNVNTAVRSRGDKYDL